MSGEAEAGCKACVHGGWGLDGERKSRHAPFRCDTELRKGIVAWLVRVRDDWFTTPGCPGFRHWKEQGDGAID